MTTLKRHPIALIVCDGWGVNPRREHNAIAMARTPCFDEMLARFPHTTLATSGLAVGLPDGQMGNSEVGHMNMGAGRIVYQELTRIDKEIREGAFFKRPELLAAMAHAAQNGRSLHLMGLLSDGGVHSMIDHLEALLDLARRQGVTRVWVHAFLDGRDTPPRSAKGFLARTEQCFQRVGVGAFATLSGRFYAMDRDNNWDRIQPAYDAMVCGVGDHAEGALAAIEAAYEAGETDEFVKPVVLNAAGRIQTGDAVVFFNFRPDRARQITRALTDPHLDTLTRDTLPQVHFTCLTQYDAARPLPVVYRPEALVDNLAQVLADRRVRQFHTAETEKYAHVTFFFNCGREAPYPLEDRVLIPSPKVKTYDLQPEMSAPAVAQAAVAAIEANQVDILIMNFANADMVGHTGNLDATVKAVEAVDQAVGRVVAAIQKAGGIALITADHGNAEQMIDYATGESHTAHTTNPVPLILAGAQIPLREGGILADIAPTILDLAGLEQPGAMTAHSLLRK